MVQPRLEVDGIAMLDLHGPPLLEEAELLASGTLISIRQVDGLGVRSELQVLA